MFSFFKYQLKTEFTLKKVSILIFIWAVFIFFLNLQINFADEYDVAIFWLSILIMIGIVVYQIFFLKNNSFVLIEIFIIYLSLHLTFQVGFYGLGESDSYIDYNFFKTILNDHNFILGQDVTGWHVDGWPMIHIFSSSLSLITKIDPLLIAKFLPSFISSIIVIPLYLLVKNIFKDKKVALFSCLIFSTIPQFMIFEGLFVREIFAFFIMILFFNILYISRRRSIYSFTFLSIILIPVIVLSHHFTSFMIIILLGIYLGVSIIIPYLYHKDVNILNRLSGKINIKIIFLIISVSAISYWIFQAVFIMDFPYIIFSELVGLEETTPYATQYLNLGAPIVTLKGNIVYYGFFFFHGLFALILLIKLIIRKNIQKIEDTSFTMFFFFCMVFGYLSLYILGSFIFPDRYLPFAWIFGIIPLTGFLLILKKDFFKKILTLLLISFIVFNLYNIDSDYYTGNASLTSVVATEKEYLIAEQINFTEEYHGYVGAVGAIYDVQGIEQRTKGKSLNEIRDFYNFSTMAVINDDIYLSEINNLKEKSQENYLKAIEILSYKNYTGIDKIYDLGNIYVLKGNR